MTTTIRLLAIAIAVAHGRHVAAQEPVDRATIARIREEGFQRSQVMTFAEYMTDVLGPRLTGSPGLRRAEQWAKTTMTRLGLTNVAVEPWGEHGGGWTNVYTSLHLHEPTYQPIIGYPLAFTPSTNGKVTGEARIVSIGTEADFAKYRGNWPVRSSSRRRLGQSGYGSRPMQRALPVKNSEHSRAPRSAHRLASARSSIGGTR